MAHPARSLVLFFSALASLLIAASPLVFVRAEGNPYKYETVTQDGVKITVEPVGTPTEEQLARCPKGGILTFNVNGLFLREQTTTPGLIRTITAFTGYGCGSATTMGFLLEELEAVVDCLTVKQANGLFIETEYRRLEDEIQTRLHEAHVNNPADYQPTWITRSTTLTLNRVFLPGIAAW